MWTTKRDLKRALLRLHDAVIAEQKAQVALRNAKWATLAQRTTAWLKTSDELARALVNARDLAGKETER